MRLGITGSGRIFFFTFVHLAGHATTSLTHLPIYREKGQRLPSLSNQALGIHYEAAAMTSYGRSRSVDQKRPEIVSFEKDLSYELASLRKLSAKNEDHAQRQKL